MVTVNIPVWLMFEVPQGMSLAGRFNVSMRCDDFDYLQLINLCKTPTDDCFLNKNGYRKVPFILLDKPAQVPNRS